MREDGGQIIHRHYVVKRCCVILTCDLHLNLTEMFPVSVPNLISNM